MAQLVRSGGQHVQRAEGPVDNMPGQRNVCRADGAADL